VCEGLAAPTAGCVAIFVVKNGCVKASSGVIRCSGTTTKHLPKRSARCFTSSFSAVVQSEKAAIISCEIFRMGFVWTIGRAISFPVTLSFNRSMNLPLSSKCSRVNSPRAKNFFERDH